MMISRIKQKNLPETPSSDADEEPTTAMTMIPFGPFLACGIWAALLWSESILQWYFSLVLI